MYVCTEKEHLFQEVQILLQIVARRGEKIYGRIFYIIPISSYLHHPDLPDLYVNLFQARGIVF